MEFPFFMVASFNMALSIENCVTPKSPIPSRRELRACHGITITLLIF
jgi:hypothetical protein